MENVKHEQQNGSLTSVEVGILWNTYMIESMVHHMSACFLKHIEDADIKSAVQIWQDSTKISLEALKSFFEQEGLPAPRGITSEDINLNAPRLFTDKYCIYYGEFMSRVALTTFTLSYTQCSSLYMKEFMKKHYVDRLLRINQQIVEISLAKGVHVRPPYIPTHKEVDFVKSKDFLAGGFIITEKRSLTVLEITQLFNIANNNAIGIATMTAYSQSTKSEEIKQHFLKGKSLSTKFYDDFSNKLSEENIPVPPQQTDLITDSTESPFSDRLMLFNDTLLSTIGLGNYGMAISGCSRHDLTALFGKAAVETGAYAEGGTKIMISNGWMEQPPIAINNKVMEKV